MKKGITKQQETHPAILEIRSRLSDMRDESHAKVLQRFFKTGPGEYGEGDVFMGLRVPQLRSLARTCPRMELDQIRELLSSPIHEERLLALLILVRSSQKGDDATREKIFRFYLENTEHINNWDLVDLSAEHILGAYLFTRSSEILEKMALSGNLWERRMAVMATFHFIKRGRFDLTLALVKTLLNDREDLIHKVCGWMLREIGKRDIDSEESFLMLHYRSMPRTMLRYAIERFREDKRLKYLKGEII